MREFRDERGAAWVASIQERAGEDYKGRFGVRFGPGDGREGAEASLEDMRWNSPKTAERTLRTMSEVELRKRLKAALGRNA